jgi:hypothetical protein
MRLYGRVKNADGTYGPWVVVQTDPNTGSNSMVYVTALCQALLLSINESPFYANIGIPGQQAVIQQVSPDFYVTRIQQRYSQYFASLIVARDGAADVPTFNVKATTFEGQSIDLSVPIPQ